MHSGRDLFARLHPGGRHHQRPQRSFAKRIQDSLSGDRESPASIIKFCISPIKECPEKTEKGKESGGSRKGKDGGEDADPPPQATTAIAWNTDKYFGTPLQVKHKLSSLVRLALVCNSPFLEINPSHPH